MPIAIPIVKSGQIALFSVAIIFSVIPTIAVALRLVARRIASRPLNAGDYCILGAWIFTIGLTIVCVLQAVYGGYGWHRTDILIEFGYSPVTMYHILTLPLEMFWTLSLSMTKISLLLLYIKVFPVSWLTLVSKVTIVAVALFALTAVLCTLLICQPIQYNWDLTIIGGHCGNQTAVFAIYGILNLVTDIAVFALPIPSLARLKLPRYKKVALVTTFSLGFLTCIASVIRLIFLATFNVKDVTYSSVVFLIMTAVEPSLGLTLACVPLMRPLLKRHRRISYRFNPQGSGTPLEQAASRLKRLTTSSARRNAHKRASSSVTIPASVLRMNVNVTKDDMPAGHEPYYRYQAQVSAGGGEESDGRSEARDHGGEQAELRAPDLANIIVSKQWHVEHEVKMEKY